MNECNFPKPTHSINRIQFFFQLEVDGDKTYELITPEAVSKCINIRYLLAPVERWTSFYGCCLLS